jgi:hypothetical protein
MSQLPCTLYNVMGADLRDLGEHIVLSCCSMVRPSIARCGQSILLNRERTFEQRQLAAPQSRRLKCQPDGPEPPLNQPAICLKYSDDGQASARLKVHKQLPSLWVARRPISTAWLKSVLPRHPGSA